MVIQNADICQLTPAHLAMQMLQCIRSLATQCATFAQIYLVHKRGHGAYIVLVLELPAHNLQSL